MNWENKLNVENVIYLSKPETNRNLPSRAQVTRAPFTPFGPDPTRIAALLARGSKIRTLPSLQTDAIYDPQGLHANPNTFTKWMKSIVGYYMKLYL